MGFTITQWPKIMPKAGRLIVGRNKILKIR